MPSNASYLFYKEWVVLFNIKQETLPREELEALQLRRLRDLCDRVYANVPFYRKRFDEAGVTPADIKSLADLKLLPFTEKQDLRNYYPFGLFAVPRDHIVRLHASSGTTGKAVVVGYTARDLENWAELMARSMSAAGVTRSDVVHVAYGYGLFTGGLGAHYGAERIGATVVPASGGATRRQAHLMRDFGATVLCATPSYSLHLWEAAQEAGVDFRELALHIGIFGAEPWSEAMRRDIEEKMHIDALNIYGLSEIMGPGVAMECVEAKCGMHLWEDHILPEIIDPVTGEQLPPGQVGELVLTTLTKEGIPMLRYRTRDLTSLNYTPCCCGRTHVRISRLQGRSDDMLIIRGVNVFPQQIEGLLMESDGLTPNYQIIVGSVNNLDTLEVRVEVSDSLFADEIRKLQMLENRLQKNIKEFLGVTAKVRLMEPRSIQRSEGKAQRIVDQRGKD
jgi:phenylacetate-CoA ligase